MRDVKRIVCLANARKLHGRCVAGREWNDGRAGRWIRPVSNREHQEVSEYERQYEDGSDPRVLDVIDVPVVEPRPWRFQSENWLLDPEILLGEGGQAVVVRFAGARGSRSSALARQPQHVPRTERQDSAGNCRFGRRLAEAGFMSTTSSSRCFKPGEAFGKHEAAWSRDASGMGEAGTACGSTDPVYERQYLAKLDGAYSVGECFSHREPWGAVSAVPSTKLIASIIARTAQVAPMNEACGNVFYHRSFDTCAGGVRCVVAACTT